MDGEMLGRMCGGGGMRTDDSVWRARAEETELFSQLNVHPPPDERGQREF